MAVTKCHPKNVGNRHHNASKIAKLRTARQLDHPTARPPHHRPSQGERDVGRDPVRSIPACMAGWRVLTRPPSISGAPVSVDTSSTVSPAARRAAAVPPEATRETPVPARPAASSTTPRLSETLSNAAGERSGHHRSLGAGTGHSYRELGLDTATGCWDWTA